MKKIQILFITIPLLLFACSSHSPSSGFKPFDPVKLATNLKKERNISPKLPTRFPVKIQDFEIIPQTYNESSVHEIQFTGETNEKFFLMIHTNDVTYDGKPQGHEEITINGNKGFYAKDELTSSTHWKDGDYHYIFEYQIVESGKDAINLTKDQMLKVAESFQ